MKDLFGIDNTKKEFAFDSNLELRIRNFDLSPDDYMMPIFEAISNSIHSINEFFGIKKAVTKGNIVVEFIKTLKKRLLIYLITSCFLMIC